MDGYVALYVFLFVAIVGYLLVSKVPNMLQTPFLTASSFINGIVLIGTMFALGAATPGLHTIIAFIAVTLAAANTIGCFVVTKRNIKALASAKYNNSGEK